MTRLGLSIHRKKKRGSNYPIPFNISNYYSGTDYMNDIKANGKQECPRPLNLLHIANVLCNRFL